MGFSKILSVVYSPALLHPLYWLPSLDIFLKSHNTHNTLYRATTYLANVSF